MYKTTTTKHRPLNIAKLIGYRSNRCTLIMLNEIKKKKRKRHKEKKRGRARQWGSNYKCVSMTVID